MEQPRGPLAAGGGDVSTRSLGDTVSQRFIVSPSSNRAHRLFSTDFKAYGHTETGTRECTAACFRHHPTLHAIEKPLAGEGPRERGSSGQRRTAQGKRTSARVAQRRARIPASASRAPAARGSPGPRGGPARGAHAHEPRCGRAGNSSGKGPRTSTALRRWRNAGARHKTRPCPPPRTLGTGSRVTPGP